MSITIHNSPDEITYDIPHVYYQKGYFNSQTYHDFVAFSDDNFFIAFDLINNEAISIPRSPFGSIFQKKEGGEIAGFVDSFCNHLKEKGIQRIAIAHPSAIYGQFASPSFIDKTEFSLAYSDINQHLVLNNDWEASIHKMQKRKLENLKSEGFEFRKMDEFETAHQFLTVCRQAHGLQINISWEQLKKLTHELPEKYECFGVFRDSKISALCIAVNVTDDIAYYYLPATSPMFRNQSPMVMLIAGMVDYYRNKGFKYLDLGVSSLEGKSQETLKLFKERMGGVVTTKPTFQLHF